MADLEYAEDLLEDLDDLEDGEADEIEDAIEELLAEEDDDFGDAEDDDFGDAAERRRRRRRRRRGRRGRKSARRVPKMFESRLKGLASKQEVKALGQRVRSEVQRLEKKVTSNRNRISTLSSRTASNRSGIKGLRKDMDSMRQMTMLMTLLGGEKDYTLREAATDATNQGSILKVKETGDAVDKMLPLLLMGGLGGKGGGLGDNPLMMVLLIDAMK